MSAVSVEVVVEAGRGRAEAAVGVSADRAAEEEEDRALPEMVVRHPKAA